MPTAIDPTTVTSSHYSHKTGPTDPFFAKMEQTQRAVDAHFHPEDLSGGRVRGELQQLPPTELGKEVRSIVSKIWEQTGGKPVAERLLELTAKVAEIAEAHIAMKKNVEFEKKGKMHTNVAEQQGLKNWQAFANGASGFGGGFLSLAAAFLPGQVGEVVSGLAKLTPNMAQSAQLYIDGKITPKQFEQSLYLSTVSSDRQAIENFKRLPEEMRNLVLELVRLSRQTTGEIFQGR